MEIIIAAGVWVICGILGYSLYSNLKVAMDAKRYFEENYKDK